MKVTALILAGIAIGFFALGAIGGFVAGVVAFNPMIFFPTNIILLGVGLTFAGVFCLAGALPAYISYRLFKNELVNKLEIEKNLKSENFQKFIEHYVVVKRNFIPNEDELCDPKLHSIYQIWKNGIKRIEI